MGPHIHCRPEHINAEMNMNSKEVTKFFSGFAANQVLTHGAFALAGTQFTAFGISYTPTLNTTAAVIWALILIVLFYYAWIKD